MKLWFVFAAALLGAQAFASSPIRCTVTLAQPYPRTPDHYLIAPMADVLVYDLPANQEATYWFNVKRAANVPAFVQYTAYEVGSQSEATFKVEFSKTDKNDGTKFPDGGYGVTFGLVNNPTWMAAGGDFAMAANVPLESGGPANGIAVLTCTEKEGN